MSNRVIPENFPIKKTKLSFQITPWEALRAELLFALDLRITTKPVNIAGSDRSGSKASGESEDGNSHRSSKSSLSKSVASNKPKLKSSVSTSLHTMPSKDRDLNQI